MSDLASVKFVNTASTKNTKPTETKPNNSDMNHMMTVRKMSYL